MKLLVPAVLLTCSVTLAWAFFSAPTPKPTPVLKTMELTSESVRSVYDLFDKHEVRATHQKTGKYLLLTGKISKIFFDGQSTCVFFDLNLGHGVRCHFRPSEIESVVKLDVGQSVTILGECNGLRRQEYVLFYECKVISDKEELPVATVKVPVMPKK
jgi:hypothetical protein